MNVDTPIEDYEKAVSENYHLFEDLPGKIKRVWNENWDGNSVVVLLVRTPFEQLYLFSENGKGFGFYSDGYEADLYKVEYVVRDSGSNLPDENGLMQAIFDITRIDLIAASEDESWIAESVQELTKLAGVKSLRKMPWET